MGGLLMVGVMILSLLCFGSLKSGLLWIGMLTLVLFGGLGFWDDYKKLILKDSKGLAGKWKYFWQSIFSLGVAWGLLHLFHQENAPLVLMLPFVHHAFVLSPLSFVVLAYFTMTGSSNAVNLTDGLDGLAILSIMIVGAGLALEALRLGGADAPTLILCAVVLIGSGLGFWWFNCFPASLFMGDVGSLALGAFLGMMAIALQRELMLFIMGGIFVIETLSVILQVGSYRLRNKKRIFKMAPIHHHFELLGIPEPKVVVRFTLISLFLVILTLGGGLF